MAIRAGATAVLLDLGTVILPSLEAILVTERCEARLLRLAGVIVDLGHRLPVQERVSLQMTLEIVGTQAPTPECRQNVGWC